MTYYTLSLPRPEEGPKTTYYYRRADGSVFACGEKEASKIHGKYAQHGVSDGQLFHSLVRKAVKDQNDALEALSRKRKGRAWDSERQRIADKARADMTAAYDADMASCEGKASKPNDSGLLYTSGKFDNATLNSLSRMMR